MKYIYKKGQLEEPETRKFMRQIVSAVDHLHRAGIIHRYILAEDKKLAVVLGMRCHRYYETCFASCLADKFLIHSILNITISSMNLLLPITILWESIPLVMYTLDKFIEISRSSSLIIAGYQYHSYSNS